MSSEDGYTLGGYVQQEEGLHPAVRFKFRPMLHEERLLFSETVGRKPPLEASRLMCNIIAKHVVEWDARDRKGDLRPLTPEGVRLLEPNLIDRMYAIVTGRVPSDADPEQLDKLELDAESQALLEGVDIGSAREARDGKN